MGVFCGVGCLAAKVSSNNELVWLTSCQSRAEAVIGDWCAGGHVTAENSGAEAGLCASVMAACVIP